MLEVKRAYLERRLKEIGFRVLPAQGTYFLVADFRQARCQMAYSSCGMLKWCIFTWYAALHLGDCMAVAGGGVFPSSTEQDSGFNQACLSMQ